MSKDLCEYGALSLAFLGDSVLETMLREKLVNSGISDTGVLTETAQQFSKAQSQSNRLENIINLLSQDENEIYLRARNHKMKMHPHSASAIQYRRATGLEAVFGWLYLKKDFERINQLFDLIYSDL